MTKAEVEALHPDDQARLAWDGAAHGRQRPPAGGWRTWVFLGGREGAGGGGVGVGGAASPDRADALVWAVTDLLIDGGGVVMPRARAL